MSDTKVKTIIRKPGAPPALEFFDKEEVSNPLNGTKIRDKLALSKLLDSLRTRRPFIFELVSDSGYQLDVGVGGDVGCVQHSPIDGDTPYLMAVAPGQQPTNGTQYVEFLMAQTPTPILKRYCVPFDLLKQIVIHFLETGRRGPQVSWEEI